MTMTVEYTRGVVPSVNDIVAGLAVTGAYVTRFGVVAEGVSGPWLLPLYLTTDVVLPILGAIWLLALPGYALWHRVNE